MARYVIKPGHMAFVDGSLREAGYEFVREKAYEKTPEHLAIVTDAAKRKAPKAGVKAVEEKAKAVKATPNFMDGKDETDDIIASGKTVQL